MTEHQTPKELALEDLARSGLTLDHAKALKLEALTPEQTAKLHPTFKRAPALKIPYFDLRGKPVEFYRVRYLELNGFDALKKKPMRYTQLPGTAPAVYFPPLGGFRWDALAAARDRSLLITEGEKKAAAACAAGFPTIGLGGVWSWKSAKAGLPLIPDLAAIAWEARDVYFVFDSDFRSNPDVMRALTALASELGARGAKPRMALLPAGADGKKVGLDDFLVACGPKDFAALLKTAEPFSMLEELWKLNAEVVYVRDPGIVIVLADGQKLTPGAFKEHAFVNRYYFERQLSKEGHEHLVKKPAAPAWLGWERRSELSRITYAPGKPRVLDGAYNYWPGWGVEPKRGDVRPWKELLDYFFDADGEARTWFERWWAYPIQHPGTKLYTASVVWGPVHGTGKSLIGYSVGKVYGKNFTEISDTDLGGSFNEWVENKQLVMGDDVTSSEYKKALMDELKFMITRHTLRVNAKYLPTYTVPDCVNYYFTANAPDAFTVEDTDRRYFVWEAPRAALPTAFYDRYDELLHHGPLASALFYHLLHLDLGGFNPRAAAPMTAAKKAMILDSKTDLGAWVATLKEAPDAVLRVGESVLAGDLFTTKQLLALYDPTESKRVSAVWLGRELKRAGFAQVNGGAVIATARGPQRLYAVRNAERWAAAKPGDIAKAYDEAHPIAPGGATTKEKKY